jgi:hypothetical protein
MNAIQAFVPPEVVKTIAAFLEFCYVARRNIITDDSLKQLNTALHDFHKYRRIFLGTVRADDASAFSLPRQHSMVHYHDHIKNLGSPNGLCSSITESKHITAVKRPWRRSNKHVALPQMLRVNERLDKIAAARVDFATRGMLVDSCFIQAIKDTFGEDPMDEDVSDDDEADSDDEIRATHARTQDFGYTRTHGPNDIDTPTHEPNDIDTPTHGPDDVDTRTHNLDDINPPRQPSPTLPDDDGDDDCGPVESGPLMNEVRLVGRKGQ